MERKSNGWRKKAAAVAAALLCLALACAVWFTGGCARETADSEPVFVGGSGSADDGDDSREEESVSADVVLPLADFSSTPVFFAADIGGVTVKIIGYTYGSSYRIMLDLCNTCKGSPNAYFKYVRISSGLVSSYKLQCQQCKSAFALSAVGLNETDSCHPIPVTGSNRTVTAEHVVVSYGFLETYAPYFRFWNG